MMEFAENLQTMQNQRKELLTKIKKKNLVMSEKNRTFASDDDEPSTLDGLKRELTFQKFSLETKERQIQERKDKIKKIEGKIKELEQNSNGKS